MPGTIRPALPVVRFNERLLRAGIDERAIVAEIVAAFCLP